MFWPSGGKGATDDVKEEVWPQRQGSGMKGWQRGARLGVSLGGVSDQEAEAQG